MNIWLCSLLQVCCCVFFAPILIGWIRCLKCWMQNRSAPSILQPYKELRKLFHKENLVAQGASWIFKFTPYLLFSVTVIASLLIPVLTFISLPFGIGDVIVLVGLFALGRFFLTLAGMDIGTVFGGMGASREMLISAIAEPALLLVFFTLAMDAGSTNLATIVQYVVHLGPIAYMYPSFVFVFLGLVMIALAETGRIPIDNPTTHLELTMIHEAMILEYSGKSLALMEWAAEIKLMIFLVLICNVFFPWGIAIDLTLRSLLISLLILLGKLLFCGFGLALIETSLAKMRLFRAPFFLGVAFALCVLGLLSHILLEVV